MCGFARRYWIALLIGFIFWKQVRSPIDSVARSRNARERQPMFEYRNRRKNRRSLGRPRSRSLFIGHLGAKCFPQPVTGGTKKEKRTKKERKGGLLKLPQLMEIQIG